MVRPKKIVNSKQSSPRKNNGTSSSSSSDSSDNQPLTIMYFWKSIALAGCLSIVIAATSLGYLETRVNTPFSNEKVQRTFSDKEVKNAPERKDITLSLPYREYKGMLITKVSALLEVVEESGLAVPHRYWGSYRPGVYFGMKTRDPQSPVFGLMWYQPALAHRGIRHWCEQGDDLPSYGWIRHDGITFGEQVIEDPPHTLRTSFIKTLSGDYGGHWTARIEVNSTDNSVPLAIIWYVALDESLGLIEDARLWVDGGALAGHTPATNNFKINFHTHKGKVLHTSYTEAHASGLHLLKEKVYSLLQVAKHKILGNHVILTSEEDLHIQDKGVNFVAYQFLIETPLVLDVVYSKEMSIPLQGKSYDEALEEKRKTFDKKFEDKFGLSQKGYSDEDVSSARAAMSNMVGGIGYFYGSSKVQSQHNREPVPYWKAPLYTAVPSRSFFPRGFLWDEGFHGLLISKWDPDIQMDILAHWLDLTNVEGWIPREQILGDEALARVPNEYVVQNNAVANPPMLMIQIAHMVETRPQLFGNHSPHRRTLERMYTRLQTWYNWFLVSQRGTEWTSFRWRGRVDDGLQLNPKTLPSGIDDYPRASHPTESERHVDLRCWMYAAADAMVTIAQALQLDASKYKTTRSQLGDEALLNELHWSPHAQQYADYGLHTDGARLVKKPAKHQEPARVVRQVTVPPKERFVTSAFGYVSLFPMLLKVLRPDSPKLGKIFEDLDKPELLWSPYGLRSLSKTSPFYMKRNTEHDPPYWRGQVWISINYLALGALKHYSKVTGPYAARAANLHKRLRENVVRNVLSEYKRTGYFWEHYSGVDGKGAGCRPFTGWTALVVLIMAGDY